MAAGELSNQVYTAPKADNYLEGYANIMRGIPDAGKQFAQAQLQQAQIEKANQEYEFMKQKAKEFTEQYPAFKDYQRQKWDLELAKARRDAGLDPFRREQMAAQTDYIRAKTGDLGTPRGASAVGGIKVPPPPGSAGGAGNVGAGAGADAAVSTNSIPPIVFPKYDWSTPAPSTPPEE